MCRDGALRPSMRTLGGKVVGGRWGRSPVWWRLVGGVQGRLRCVLLCCTVRQLPAQPPYVPKFPKSQYYNQSVTL